MVVSREWISAINELEKEGVTAVACPECGQAEFRATEMRRESDPDFLLGKFYQCANCGVNGESRIAKRVPKVADG